MSFRNTLSYDPNEAPDQCEATGLCLSDAEEEFRLGFCSTGDGNENRAASYSGAPAFRATRNETRVLQGRTNVERLTRRKEMEVV